jgi:hypothetical protein
VPRALRNARAAGGGSRRSRGSGMARAAVPTRPRGPGDRGRGVLRDLHAVLIPAGAPDNAARRGRRFAARANG